MPGSLGLGGLLRSKRRWSQLREQASRQRSAQSSSSSSSSSFQERRRRAARWQHSSQPLTTPREREGERAETRIRERESFRSSHRLGGSAHFGWAAFPRSPAPAAAAAQALNLLARSPPLPPSFSLFAPHPHPFHHLPLSRIASPVFIVAAMLARSAGIATANLARSAAVPVVRMIAVLVPP